MGERRLTGGRVNYYLAEVTHPQREDQKPYQAECEDIIRALNMTFDEACEFKAIWRTASARLGNGKPDHKAVYDAEKRLHYAGASLRQERIKQEAAEAEGWVQNLTGKMPFCAAGKLVEVMLVDGTHHKSPEKAERYCWVLGEPSSISQYRFT